jgi:hypothetical protein
MGQHSATDDGRKCWRTARERDRLRARFLIRERVATSSNETPLDAVTSPTTIELSPLDIQKLQQNLRYIQSGDRSKFSLTLMQDQHQLLSSPISTEHLQESLPQSLQLCTAWFGIEYATFLDQYISSLETFTVLEYAAWMKKYSILGALLVGGVSPCVRSASSAKEQNTEWHERLQKLGTRVLKRFFDAFPLPLSTYIVKRVVDLRMDAYRNRDQTNSNHVACTKCQQQIPPSFQLWVSPCGHAICEPCFWQDMMDHIDERDNLDDVVLCPKCGVSGTESSTGHDNRLSNQEAMTPSRKCQKSLEKYKQLPLNRQALKARREKRKKLSEKEYLASSWFAAVAPSLGLSQDVRRDKFFASIERNAIHYARGCLVTGVDIHWTNDYGQTALYMCAWRGNAKMVQLFLEYGADPSVYVNGGSTVSSVCKANGHEDVLSVLHEYGQWEEADDAPVQSEHPLSTVSIREDEIPLHVETLIEEDLDHPGAGSYVIDDILPPDSVYRFLELWRSLPTDTSHQKKKGVPCSVRSYYCDAEGYARELLLAALERTHLATPKHPVNVFPHMRFLNYAEAGTVLAPHVDLCRVDPVTGNRSTHSFLLYLTDCEVGGETFLLGDISGDERNNVLASVSPKRGRLLLFPHACPHEGNEVHDVPKILLRGEVMLSTARMQEQS